MWAIWLLMKLAWGGVMEGRVGRKKLFILKLKESNPTGQSFSFPEIRHIRNLRNFHGNVTWSRSWSLLWDQV